MGILHRGVTLFDAKFVQCFRYFLISLNRLNAVAATGGYRDSPLIDTLSTTPLYEIAENCFSCPRRMLAAVVSDPAGR
jgi:hypothetical protein